jgi:hypothetical protein
MANTASLDATDRIVSRCTEAGSAAALRARAFTRQRTWLITYDNLRIRNPSLCRTSPLIVVRRS